jgi:peptidoglycan/LPS O-acetylase OafA/YrhL
MNSHSIAHKSAPGNPLQRGSYQNAVGGLTVVKSVPGRAASSLMHLNLLRGLAAFAVLFSHLRSFVFVPYGELDSHWPLNSAVWLATGFGHQAVMVFFVLSGFFISKSIIEDYQANRFTWQVYLIKRLTRLWTVLIPCLILTLILDESGRVFSDGRFYEGKLMEMYNFGPSEGLNLDISTLIGNAFFLQTVVAPVFGSNAPLWSLANEWWYYMLFPLIYVTTRNKGGWLNVSCGLAIFSIMAWFVGKDILLAGLVWLLGVAAYIIYERQWFVWLLRRRVTLGVAFVLFALSLAASKASFGTDLFKDYCVGFGSTLLVLPLAAVGGGSGRLYSFFAQRIADASYSLYLAHFPFMAFIASVVLKNQRFGASISGYAVFIAFGLVSLLYCYGVFWFFERHTAKVRRYCLGKFRRPSVAMP